MAYTFEQQTRVEVLGLKTLLACFLQQYWGTVDHPRGKAKALAEVFERAMAKSAIKMSNAEDRENLRDLALHEGLEVIAESLRGLPADD